MNGTVVKQRPMVSVIIVSYNTCAMTLDCLRALMTSVQDIDLEVIVVDNASSDDSVEKIRSEFPNVRVIANEQNVGFGAANNQAMRQAGGEFFLLLNSDAFLQLGATSELLDYLHAHLHTGVVGPRLTYGDGSLQTSCWRFPSPLRAWMENLGLSTVFPNHPVLGDYRNWPHDTEREVDWMIGACLLIRRTVYEQVGGFDERFFMYAEETDWQRRIRAKGWAIVFTPRAHVTHLGGASGATEKVRINRYFFGSMDRYLHKHHGLLGLISLRCAMAVGAVPRVLVWGIFSVLCPKRRARAVSKARLHLWLLFRQTMCWHFEG
jgi:GT2 family glycosyltransferase